MGCRESNIIVIYLIFFEFFFFYVIGGKIKYVYLMIIGFFFNLLSFIIVFKEVIIWYKLICVISWLLILR